MNKLMAMLAIGAAALAAVWVGGAAEADEDRFRFGGCSVEFILQDGRFVAVDGRSWLEVDPAGECHEMAENDESSEEDESAGGEGDDSSADDGGDGSRSAAAEANQQDDGEEGTGSADGSFEPPISARMTDEIASWAQEQQDSPGDWWTTCTDAVKPKTGPTLISFRHDRHCVFVRYAGVMQLSRGDYTLNVTLPADGPPGHHGWRLYSFSHGLVGTSFVINNLTIGMVSLNAADGSEIKRDDHTCVLEGHVLFDVLIALDGAYVHSLPGVPAVCAPVAPGFPALLDAIVASATVPAAE